MKRLALLLLIACASISRAQMISALPAGGAVGSDDWYLSVQGGVTCKVTAAQMATFMGGGGSIAIGPNFTSMGVTLSGGTLDISNAANSNGGLVQLQEDGSLMVEGSCSIDGGAIISDGSGDLSITTLNAGNSVSVDGNLIVDGTISPLQINYAGLGDGNPLANGYGVLFWGGDGGGNPLADNYDQLWLRGALVDSTGSTGPGVIYSSSGGSPALWTPVDPSVIMAAASPVGQANGLAALDGSGSLTVVGGITANGSNQIVDGSGNVHLQYLLYDAVGSPGMAGEYLQNNGHAPQWGPISVQKVISNYTPVNLGACTSHGLSQDEFMYIQPAGTLAHMYLNLDTNNDSPVGQTIDVYFTQAVTNLVIQVYGGGGAQPLGNPITSAAANQSFEFVKIDSTHWLYVR